ncbi:MAG: hypothetical protein ABI912_06635 [Actinomycetota bacterium]
MVTVTAALLAWKHRPLQSEPSALWLVRGAALLLTVGALPILDDPAARQIAAVPLSLARRSAIRLTAIAGIVFVPVSALAAWSSVSVGDVLIETTAIVSIACSASMLFIKSWDLPEPSMIVSVAFLPLSLLLLRLPTPLALLVGPGPAWNPAHQRWSVVLCLGVWALSLALRDPAATMFLLPTRRAVRRHGPVREGR